MKNWSGPWADGSTGWRLEAVLWSDLQLSTVNITYFFLSGNMADHLGVAGSGVAII